MQSANFIVEGLTVSRPMKRFVFLFSLSWSMLLLSGCVTEGGQLFTTKVDMERALQTRVQLGLAYLEKGDTTSAKVNMVRALEINPKSGVAHAGLAQVFQRDGELDLAEEHYKKSLSLQPENTLTRDAYGQFLFSQKRFEDALDEFKVVTEDTLYEHRPRSFFWLGLCHLNLKEMDKAEKSFIKVMGMGGDRRLAARELSKLYFAKEDYSNAKQYFDYYTQDVIKDAADLWIGLRIERIFGNLNIAESYALALKNLYPYSSEYLQYKKMYGNK